MIASSSICRGLASAVWMLRVADASTDAVDETAESDAELKNGWLSASVADGLCTAGRGAAAGGTCVEVRVPSSSFCPRPTQAGRAHERKLRAQAPRPLKSACARGPTLASFPHPLPPASPACCAASRPVPHR